MKLAQGMRAGRLLTELARQGVNASSAAPAPPRLRDRIAVALNRFELDRQLADGVEPSTTARLRLRAEQLQRRRNRERMADGIDRSLAAAERHSRLSWPKVLVDRERVVGCRPQLREVASLLRGEKPLGVRGLAMVNRMLTHASSPLLAPSEPYERRPDALATYLQAALAALEDGSSCPPSH
jgi:hypothetical protein